LFDPSDVLEFYRLFKEKTLKPGNFAVSEKIDQYFTCVELQDNILRLKIDHMRRFYKAILEIFRELDTTGVNIDEIDDINLNFSNLVDNFYQQTTYKDISGQEHNFSFLKLADEEDDYFLNKQILDLSLKSAKDMAELNINFEQSKQIISKEKKSRFLQFLFLDEFQKIFDLLKLRESSRTIINRFEKLYYLFVNQDVYKLFIDKKVGRNEEVWSFLFDQFTQQLNILKADYALVLQEQQQGSSVENSRLEYFEDSFLNLEIKINFVSNMLVRIKQQSLIDSYEMEILNQKKLFEFIKNEYEDGLTSQNNVKVDDVYSLLNKYVFQDVVQLDIYNKEIFDKYPKLIFGYVSSFFNVHNCGRNYTFNAKFLDNFQKFTVQFPSFIQKK
jgi:hypothetical protein